MEGLYLGGGGGGGLISGIKNDLKQATAVRFKVKKSK